MVMGQRVMTSIEVEYAQPEYLETTVFIPATR